MCIYIYIYAHTCNECILHIDMIYLEVQLLFWGARWFPKHRYFVQDDVLPRTIVSIGLWLPGCVIMMVFLSPWTGRHFFMLDPSQPHLKLLSQLMLVPEFASQHHQSSLGDHYFRAVSGVGFSWKGLKKLCGYISWFQSHMTSNPSRQLLPKLKPIFVAVEL